LTLDCPEPRTSSRYNARQNDEVNWHMGSFMSAFQPLILEFNSKSILASVRMHMHICIYVPE